MPDTEGRATLWLSPRLTKDIDMSVFADYINNLEGQDSIDPVAVARDLSELHKTELGTREAKISQLEGTVAEKDSLIAARDADVERWKAKNFDLTMQIPSNDTGGEQRQEPDEKPSAASIKIGDLFSESVRRKHGL